MRVKVWLEREVWADVTLDDLFAELDTPPDSAQETAIITAINIAHGILKRISDDRIAEINNERRKLIGTALRDQAARYMPSEE